MYFIKSNNEKYSFLNISIMKTHYIISKKNSFIMLLTVSLLFISCGTYQSAYSNDGIYDDVIITKRQKKVIVVDEQEYQKQENNYFTKEMERLDNLNGTDILVDIDNYKSLDSIDDVGEIEEEIIEERNERLTYNENEPWGYNDENVVIYVN